MSDRGGAVVRVLGLLGAIALVACSGASDDPTVPPATGPGDNSPATPGESTPSSPGPSPTTPGTTQPAATGEPGPSTTPQTPLPVPPGAVVYHFSDCQQGAAPTCVPGDDANPGTEASPKRDWQSVDFNALPAGSQLRFKRGGAWNVPITRLENENVTPTAPLVFDAYDTGPAPIFRGTHDSILIEFGGLNNTNNDGGYYFRSLKLDGGGLTDWAFWLRDNLRNVTIENVEITGFEIAVHLVQSPPHYITAFNLRSSIIRQNSEMGLLGGMTGGTIENNLFERNNFSGSTFNHAIYLTGGSDNRIVNNRFLRNSVVDGTCTGGNVTVHGQNVGLRIEGNLIEQDAAGGGCYGFSLTPGYDSAEWFRQTVVRNNKIVNVGYCGVCAGAAPGIVVENNVSWNTQPDFYHAAVNIPTSTTPGSGDDVDANAIVRDNVLCQATPNASSTAANVTGAGHQASNNVLRTGVDATTGPCAR